MIVQHNITAMNSNRMLGLTTSAQAKSTEKLSSGYKINRAADDAAGLTISEKMRRQIRGLTQASLNAQDGISCVQTAEGALTEVHDMLQRMDELATKAANGTMTTEDRQAVQDEIDQLITEIDRVSETTTFNELALLKGGGTETTTHPETTVDTPMKAEYADGYDPTIKSIVCTNDDPDTGFPKVEWYAKGETTDKLSANDVIGMLEFDENGELKFKDGMAIYTAAADDAGEFGAQTKDTIVSLDTVKTYFGSQSSALAKDDAGTEVKAEDLASFFNDDGTYKGGLYKLNADGDWTEVGAEQIADYVKVTPEVKGETKDVSVTTTKALEFSLHVGAESDPANKISVSIDAMSAEGIGVDILSKTGVMTQDDATSAIDTIKAAVSHVSRQRSALGAVQNRLEHTINNLDNVVENTTSAEAQIRDTDIATEMVKYANNNILQQAGTSMLSQANQSNQLALSLLG